MQKILFNLQNLPLFLLLVFNLVVGAVYIKDYGLSWDEPSRFRDAEKSLASYLGTGKEPSGRLYLAISEIGADAINIIFKNWTSVESWHYFNFIYFQLSLIFFYLICLRFFDRWVSLATTLLYASQPLLWGHAFINPKDIPFTMYFLGSLGFGLRAMDVIAAHQVGKTTLIYPHQELAIYWAQIKKEWSGNDMKRRKNVRWITMITLGLFIITLLLTPVVGWIIKLLMTRAVQGIPNYYISRLFIVIAEGLHDIPPELYAQKAIKLYLRVISGYGIIAILLNLTMVIFVLPHTLRQLWNNEFIPMLKDGFSYLKNGNIWAAGFCIGMATSVRVLGPVAWLLLIGYLLLKFGRKAFPPALTLLVIAVFTMVLSWPRMWVSPLQAFQNTASKSADFPWESTVMFGGLEYPADQLPRSYLPVLISLQLTEPALLLFLGGLGLALAGLKNRRLEWQMSTLFAAWFFIPLVGVIVLQPTMYDNFRHFTFILPAFFLFCGICLKSLFGFFNHRFIRSAILLLCLLPSVYWIIKLHPYQYIYYNSLTGGMSGAFRNYELDYWATSYREATQYINEIAPLNARVMVWGPVRLGTYYCRPDLEIQRSMELWDEDESSVPIYAIISTRHNKDQQISPNAPELFWVERSGARLVVVKQLSP